MVGDPAQYNQTTLDVVNSSISDKWWNGASVEQIYVTGKSVPLCSFWNYEYQESRIVLLLMSCKISLNGTEMADIIN